MDSKSALKLKALTFILTAANACFFPFQPVYYSSRNLNFTQIGIAFAVGALISMLFQPVWGYISDKYLNKKKTMLIVMAANTLVTMLFITAHSFTAVILLIVLNSIFFCGIIPLLDAYTFDMIDGIEGLNYSQFRFVASAAFALTNLVMGYTIKKYGITFSFILYGIFVAIGMIILFSIKFEGKKNIQRIELKDIKPIFANTTLVILFITVFLMNIAIAGGSNFTNELIKYTRGDVSKLGMVWFITCIFEMVTFCFTNRLMKKIGIVNVYLIGTFIYGLKFILDFLSTSANLVIIFQLFEGIAFAMYISSGMEYLNRNVPSEVRATAVTVFTAFAGLGSFMAGLFGGMVLNVINPPQLFAIFGVMCFAALSVGYMMKLGKTRAANPVLDIETLS